MILIGANSTAARLAADSRECRDREVMQALATVGALVALADGRVKQVERDELTSFIARQGFVAAAMSEEIATAFDERVRQLDERYSPNIIVEVLRPLAGLSLASIVVRTAERVAGADGKIHPAEQQAINLIRLSMMTLPTNLPPTKLPFSSMPGRIRAEH
ncbi:MAG: TerB family tellurite resistance protein [Hyphomicrobiales bacterium]|nr:TerB family tellurite resistance protein [Hyphomicrobiales bacterium]